MSRDLLIDGKKTLRGRRRECQRGIGLCIDTLGIFFAMRRDSHLILLNDIGERY
jgi:hypothetical protein